MSSQQNWIVIDADGGRITGSGINAERAELGTYDIFFTNQFANQPAIVATALKSGGGDMTCVVLNASASHATVQVSDRNGEPQDCSLNLIALGTSDS